MYIVTMNEYCPFYSEQGGYSFADLDVVDEDLFKF